MRENAIEKYLVEQVEKHGGMCEKFVSNKRFVPDRIVTWRGGRIHFVETKTLGGKLSPGQRRDHARREQFLCVIEVIWTKAQVDSYVQAWYRV